MKFLSQINVNTEYTLPFVDGALGQVLTTDGNGAVYWGSVSAGSTNLNALTDVEITSPSAGQILRYEIPLGGSVPVWRNVTPGYLDATSSINALGDVVTSTATAGQILQFNGTYWINTTLSTVEYVSKVQHTVKAGVAITKGQAVYVTTSDGTNMIVGLASNAAESTSSKVIGLAASTAAINGQLFVVTEGLLAGLDTSTATAGDPVWLGTGGNLIFGLLNKPVAPAHLVYIGVVTRVQQNNGEIFINVQNGFELNEIHDALIVSPTAGQLLRRDSDNLWKNWTPNYLTSFTETDPTVPSHVKSISTTNITNWNTGYDDSIRAVGFSTANGVLTLTQQDGGTLTVDLDGRYLESYTEIDPIYTASSWYGTTNNSRDWDDAYAWGDHADFGYLTSFTETDPTVPNHVKGITSTNITNWDAAYNDKIASAAFNATNGVLTLTQQDGGTVTVDLDGRYLTSDSDNQELTWDSASKTLGITNGNDVILDLASEDFVTSQGYITSVNYLAIQTIGGDSGTFNLDTVSGQHGFVRFSTGTWGGTNPYPGNYSHVLSMNQSTVNGNRTVQMYMGDVPGALFWRMNQGGTLHPWERIWTAGNDGASSGLDADLLDGNHASAFALASHNHDDRYYTESESDSRFVNASGDTMSGSLSFDAAAVIKKKITGVGDNPVKTASGVLASRSDNGGGATYYIIETNVPQDEYQMGGFTIELFGRYGETNNKTKIDLGGYWNPEGNGGFIGFEAHGTNPQYKPTIEVARNNNTGKTAFIIYGVSWSYPVIVARDLWLGYNSTDGGAYGEGWVIASANDLDSYSNRDTVVWRNAYSDSNPAGYITGYSETDTLASVTGRGASTSTAISVGGLTVSTANVDVITTQGRFQVYNTAGTGNLGYRIRTNENGGWRWQFVDGGNNEYFGVDYSSGNVLTGGSVTANRFIGSNSLVLNNYTTVNPSSNVFLYSQPNDRDSWIFLDSADTGSNWGIYHRQIDSAVGDIPANSIGFVGGGSSVLQAYISLANGNAYFRGTVTASGGNSTNWNTAYGWGNHADAPYWNVSLNNDIQVESNQVTFAGDVIIQGTLTESSSIRYKENIQPLEPALAKVEQLNPVTYTKIATQEEEIGLIAEEVAELFPEVVKYNEAGQPDGLNYSRLSVILLKAVQELTNEVKELKEKLK